MSDNTARSRASVTTDRPDRYAKQLVAHLGRRNGGEWSAETHTGWIDLGSGRATVTAGSSELVLELRCAADERPRLEEVLGSHLMRFGTHDELVVTWEPV